MWLFRQVQPLILKKALNNVGSKSMTSKVVHDECDRPMIRD